MAWGPQTAPPMGKSHCNQSCCCWIVEWAVICQMTFPPMAENIRSEGKVSPERRLMSDLSMSDVLKMVPTTARFFQHCQIKGCFSPSKSRRSSNVIKIPFDWKLACSWSLKAPVFGKQFDLEPFFMESDTRPEWTCEDQFTSRFGLHQAHPRRQRRSDSSPRLDVWWRPSNPVLYPNAIGLWSYLYCAHTEHYRSLKAALVAHAQLVSNLFGGRAIRQLAFLLSS